MNKFTVYYFNISTFSKCILKVLENESKYYYTISNFNHPTGGLGCELCQKEGYFKMCLLAKYPHCRPPPLFQYIKFIDRYYVFNISKQISVINVVGISLRPVKSGVLTWISLGILMKPSLG